jgi:catechol 2,3-dioxygenase-like lactoylglutathione lyase family enzyme
MKKSGVSALRSVEIGVRDLDAAASFYTGPWGLDLVTETADARYLRGTGPYHHILVLRRHDKAEMIEITLDAPDRTAVKALHDGLAGSASEVTAPGALDRPGGGYGFSFRDAEGRRFAVVCEVEDGTDLGDKPNRPRKLSHVVLNSADAENSAALLIEKLGFTLRDRTRMFNFLGCNSDHHSIAFAYAKDATLNHIAFEMPDLESVMRGAGNLRDAGHPIEWGVGRHGPGNNVFAYFIGPEDFAIEYTAEVFQVDDRYKVGMPDDWKWPPGRVDHWGVSPPPSDRLKDAQTRIRFAGKV